MRDENEDCERDDGGKVRVHLAIVTVLLLVFAVAFVMTIAVALGFFFA